MVERLQEKTNLHSEAQDEAELLLKHRISVSRSNIETNIDVLGLEESLKEARKAQGSVLEKKDLLEVIQVKDAALQKSHQNRVTIRNIEGLIEQKTALNNQLTGLNQASFNLFKLGKILRYARYMVGLRKKVSSMCRVVPLLNSQIILPETLKVSMITIR